jgi:hypothetical protein
MLPRPGKNASDWQNPSADWNQAYEATADAANDRYRDKYADMADAAKQRAKDAGNWPPKP